MDQKRILWHWVNYVALALFFGFAILLWLTPIAFAPPHFQNTGYVYLVLLCLWVPFLLIFGHWQGRRYTCAHPALILGGIFLSGFWCMVLAPALIMPEPFRSFPIACEEETLGDGQVRYTCVQGSSDIDTTYILEGREGFPLVWLKVQQGGTPIPPPLQPPTSAP